jgi:hypothetical protein
MNDAGERIFHEEGRRYYDSARPEWWLEPCATFDEAAVERAGFDHALVGHYQQAYFGSKHTYPRAPIAHDFGLSPSRRTLPHCRRRPIILHTREICWWAWP